MSEVRNNPTAAQTDPDARQGDETEFQLRLLWLVLEVGEDVARALKRDIAADAATPSTAQPDTRKDHGAAYDRLARSIRRTIILFRRLREETVAVADRPSADKPAKRVPRATPRDTDPRELLDRLDRLERPEPSDRGKIMSAVCRDIGLPATPPADGRHSVIKPAVAPAAQRFDPSAPTWFAGQSLPTIVPPASRGGAGPP